MLDGQWLSKIWRGQLQQFSCYLMFSTEPKGLGIVTYIVRCSQLN